MGYTKTAAKGISWIALLRVSTRLLTIVRLSVLGRLLTPAQFGYYGIASLVLALLEVVTETGINVFFVQEKRGIKEFINSAWLVSIIRGFILSSLILLSTPLIVNFFNAEGALDVIVLISLVPIIRGFINPAVIIYQKELLFDKEFRFRIVLFFIEVFISIIFAFITRSASSFVYGLIASALVEVFLSYYLFSIKPRVNFDADKVGLIVRRGKWVTLTGIFSYFADNGDNIAVGKILGSSLLGIYQVAYRLSTLPISEITNVVNQVIFPVFAKLADDKKRLKTAFIKVTFLTSLIGLVLGGMLFAFAEPIILIIMGSQWVAAISVIQVLAIYGALRTMFGNFAPLFLSVGKQKYVAKMTFVRVLTLFLAIIPLVLNFGMIGAGYAMTLSIIMEIPIILFFTHKVFSAR